MQPKIIALVIDTTSIQQYIFNSNKLKENLGASYIVEEVLYKKILISLLEKIKGFSNNWEENPGYVAITKNSECDCEIGYIGGGNALVFFKNEVDVTQFIQKYSSLLLEDYPGIKTAFGINTDFNFEKFKESKKELFENLQKNKSSFFPQTVVPKHGITAECPLSSEVAEFPYVNGQSKQFISAVSQVRLTVADEAQKDNRLKAKYSFIGDNYTLAEQFEKLGQSEEKDYIAVVHIDGNSMGKRFKEQENIERTRSLSNAVNITTMKALEKFGKNVIQLIEDGGNPGEKGLSEKNGFKFQKENNKTILPFRPIITGGDDITFVCDGRLGIYFAEKFIEYLTENEIEGEAYHACAGIAIVKTKYPFYRAVKLAEELCKEAKKPTRGENNNGSFIDFYISSGGFSGSLENIRKMNHSAEQGSLHYGPYKIKGNGDENKSINRLKENIKFFSGSNWPRNKVMELREVLTSNEQEFKFFKTEMESKNRKFPMNYTNDKFLTNAFEKEDEKNVTPYYEIVELLDFYPENLL